MARILRHYVSKLFQPQNIVPKNAKVKCDDLTSRSQKLLLDLGVMRQASNGSFYLLPLGERSLQKLIDIVNEEMQRIGAQKLILPSLTPMSLWKASGRFDKAASELFTLKDRHDKEFVLAPTHEEAVTELVSSLSPLSYRSLPIRLYQITSKFRDEMKPRFGLIRAKEFIMKDLYTFDTSLEKAKDTYEAVTAVYENVFNRIGVKYVRVVGLTGLMGGSLSHEFHFPASVGEDCLVICEDCGHGSNVKASSNGEEVDKKVNIDKCSLCGHASLREFQGIEVGHTFLLGTHFSEALNAQFLQSNGKPAYLEMGCYGLGMTRILAGVVEFLSQETDIRWPLSLAPFKVCVIPPKAGSKESEVASPLADALCHRLGSVPSLSDDVIVDDRLDLTVGRRLRDAGRVGYPLVIVVGKLAMETEQVEVHNISSGEVMKVTLPEAVQYVVEQTQVDLKERGAFKNPMEVKVSCG